MSERERWVVYPLLFFSMALGLRDKVAPPEKIVTSHLLCDDVQAASVQTDKLQANSLQSPDDQSSFGIVRIQGLEIYGRSGKRILVLGPNSDTGAGELTLFDLDGRESTLRFAPIEKPADKVSQ